MSAVDAGGDIFSDMQEIEGRIDGVITFALIRFVHTMARLVLSEQELVLLSGVAIIVLYLTPRSHLDHVVLLTQKICVMVFSQSAINAVTQNQLVLHTDTQHYRILLQLFTITTCMLVLMSLLAYAFKTVDAVRRSMTLLLYIYADATELIVRTLRLGGFLAALLAIFVYLVFHTYGQRWKDNFTLLYIFRAFNMVCINLVLQSLVDVDSQFIGTEYQAAVLITVLFLVDAFSAVMPSLAETRDYAVWKSSQKLFLLVQAVNISTEVLLFACLVVLSTRPVWRSLLTSVYELALLVVINVLLDIASKYIERAYTIDKAILLFIYILIIHEVSGLVFQQKR